MDELISKFKYMRGVSLNKKNPKQLAQQLQKCFEEILYECRLEKNLDRDITYTSVPENLQNISELLVKEQSICRSESGIEPGGCTELFLNNDILTDLIRISETNAPSGFRCEVIHFLANTISLLDGNLLIQNSIHRPALHLMRTFIPTGEQDEAIVELEYNIASKIKDYPLLLQIFFIKLHKPKNVPDESAAAGNVSSFTNFSSSSSSPPHSPPTRLRSLSNNNEFVVNEYEFILFDHLLKFIHQETELGDVARTAILFLLEIDDADLFKYILASEFCVLLIAGLGGLFSQLSQTLPSSSASKSVHKSFKDDLNSFLKLVEFLQKVLLVCPSAEITQLLLDEFKCTFLDNIVHAYILSASDFDGTTVSCLFYIGELITTINEEQLSTLLCKFLLQSEEEDSGEGSLLQPDADIKLFLRDILLSKLNSLSETVVISALTVFKELLSFHSANSLHLIIETLDTTEGEIGGRVKKNVVLNVQQHLDVIAKYMGSVSTSDNIPSSGPHSLMAYFDEADKIASTYTRGLKKGVAGSPFLQKNNTNSKETSPISAIATTTINIDGEQIEEEPKTELFISESIKKEMEKLGHDTILRKFITKFSIFFSHSFEINLALSALIGQLASAPKPILYMYMFCSDSLLSVDETQPTDNDDEDGDYAQVVKHQSLLTILYKLQKEILERKASLPDYDEQLKQVRSALFKDNSGRSRSTSFSAGNLGELDLDGEFLKNVVLLEEFVKELVMIFMMHSSRDYDVISYL